MNGHVFRWRRTITHMPSCSLFLRAAPTGSIMTMLSSPAWLVDLANAMVVAHLGPAYQVRLEQACRLMRSAAAELASSAAVGTCSGVASCEAASGALPCPARLAQICIQPTFQFLEAKMEAWPRNPRWNRVRSIWAESPPVELVGCSAGPGSRWSVRNWAQLGGGPSAVLVRPPSQGLALRLWFCPSAVRVHPPPSQGLALRLWFRSMCVVLLTFLAILIPFFGSIIGLSGALSEWTAGGLCGGMCLEVGSLPADSPSAHPGVPLSLALCCHHPPCCQASGP